MFFKDIKNYILDVFQNNHDTQQVLQDETQNSLEYEIKDLGYTTFIDATLYNRISNIDNKDYTRRITFTFLINNQLLQDGIKTVALISCEYTYNGKDILYIGGSGSAQILEKAILLNESGNVTVDSNEFISKGICVYDSNGYRRCVENEDNVITINSCVLAYSSNIDENHLGNIAWFIRDYVNETNYLNLSFPDSEITINDNDIFEKVSINKTIYINREGNNQ